MWCWVDPAGHCLGHPKSCQQAMPIMVKKMLNAKGWPWHPLAPPSPVPQVAAAMLSFARQTAPAVATWPVEARWRPQQQMLSADCLLMQKKPAA